MLMLEFVLMSCGYYMLIGFASRQTPDDDEHDDAYDRGRKPSGASIKTENSATYHLQDQLRSYTLLGQTSQLWSQEMQTSLHMHMMIILIYACFIQMAHSHFTAL